MPTKLRRVPYKASLGSFQSYIGFLKFLEILDDFYEEDNCEVVELLVDLYSDVRAQQLGVRRYSDDIDRMLCWAETPEGHNYWSEVAGEIGEFLSLDDY